MKVQQKLIILSLFILFLLPIQAFAYKIIHDFTSPIGGKLTNNSVTITACNMEPFGAPTQADLDALYQKAQEDAQEGSDFKQSLGFHDCTYIESQNGPSCLDDRLKTLLLDPYANYETVGFIQAFRDSGIEAKLKSAIETYAYLVKNNYSENAALSLKQAIRDLVTIYMVFADEFLIDALDFRFSTATQNMDAYLDEQIELLLKAIDYYTEGTEAFVSVWIEPIVGTNDIIGSLFGQDEWDLFSLLHERLTMAVREDGIRERAKLVKPTDEILSYLTDHIVSLYIQSAAMSEVTGSNFQTFGSEQIMTALNTLKKQLLSYKAGFNPLGYEARYVPLDAFEDIYEAAQSILSQCGSLESEVKQEQRDYDYVLQKITEQQMALNTTYMTQLSELTGCRVDLTVENFAECVRKAGFDLYDCAIEMTADNFEGCVRLKPENNSVLGSKYRQIKDADLSLQLARTKFKNIGKQIEYENARQDYLIEIWNDLLGAQKESLKDYQDKILNSCLIKEEKTEVKYKGEKKTKTKRTEKSFTLRDDKLGLDLEKEKAAYEAAYNFGIKQVKDDTVIKNLLLQQAEALIGIDLAVQNKNAMIAMFDSSIVQKDNLLSLWLQNNEFIEKYWEQKLPNQRIILSQKILELTERFNELAHYAYLATKSLEYKYMVELQGIDIPGGKKLNATDLFKCQTTTDFSTYLTNLSNYNFMECPTGSFQPHEYRISLVYDILGLSNKNLGDLNNDGIIDSTLEKVVDVQYQKVQQFINQNIDTEGNLTFDFSSSVYDKVFQSYKKANLKIWQGGVPCASSVTTRGLTSSLFFKGSSGSIFPVIYIAQKGTQTFLRKDSELADYYPIKILAMITSKDQEPEPFTKDLFTPYNGIDPRYQSASMGEWTPAFSNRSVSATDWVVTLYREPAEYGFNNIPFDKLTDIAFYFGTIGQNFE
ncbi:MAG: hypothetical protein AB7S77_15400 [Desulfatirhabdiaceae bacterium]